MYRHYGKTPTWLAKKYMQDLIPLIENDDIKHFDQERVLLFETLDICLDIAPYLLTMSLRASARIDKRAHLHVRDDLVSYGRDAMQEMLVIRLRELFYAIQDKPDEFHFFGFYESIKKYGIKYPMPNSETNNAIWRIINRRNNYSAHHYDGKGVHSLNKNRLRSLDLITAVSYINKVEENMHGGKSFDLFDRLLNENHEADCPLYIYSVYEVLSGEEYEKFDEQIGDYVLTHDFLKYERAAKKQIANIQSKVQDIVE